MQLGRVVWPDNFRVCVGVQRGAPPANFRVPGTPERRPAAPAPPSGNPRAPGELPYRPGQERGGAARARRSPTGRLRRARCRHAPWTTLPSMPRAARAPQLTHFPARPGLGRPPRRGGCSLLTGVWAGSGGGRRRRCCRGRRCLRCWALGSSPGFCGCHGRAGGSRRLLQQQPPGRRRCQGSRASGGGGRRRGGCGGGGPSPVQPPGDPALPAARVGPLRGGESPVGGGAGGAAGKDPPGLALFIPPLRSLSPRPGPFPLPLLPSLWSPPLRSHPPTRMSPSPFTFAFG